MARTDTLCNAEDGRLLVGLIKLGHVTVTLDAAVQNAPNGQHQLDWKTRDKQYLVFKLYTAQDIHW